MRHPDPANRQTSALLLKLRYLNSLTVCGPWTEDASFWPALARPVMHMKSRSSSQTRAGLTGRGWSVRGNAIRSDGSREDSGVRGEDSALWERKVDIKRLP